MAAWHDFHKVKGMSHDVPVEKIVTDHERARFPKFVPFWNREPRPGVDGAALRMSRWTFAKGRTPPTPQRVFARTPLVGTPQPEPDWYELAEDIYPLFSTWDVEELHRRWMDDKTVSKFSESPIHRFTSLKYHVLLTMALTHGEYNNDLSAFGLSTKGPALAQVHPIGLFLVRGGGSSLDVGNDERNFGDVWSGMIDRPAVPRYIDATIRRMLSWSTALQYLEDVT